MRTAFASPVCNRPSVSLAATTATTPSPSRATPLKLPFSTDQPRTAGLPPRFMSALAEQGPVQTSQVLASVYFPVLPAASVGLLQANTGSTATRDHRATGRGPPATHSV